MSEVEFHFGPAEEPIRIVITSDGDMLCPDGELEQEQMLAFMTGQESDLTKLYKKWVANPIPTIIQDFGVPEPVKRLLLIDSAERVLPIFEKTAGPKQSRLARRVMKQTRSAFSQDGNKVALGVLDRLVRRLGAGRSGVSQLPAENNAFSAIFYAARRVGERITFTNFNPACLAVAHNAAHHDNPREADVWKQAYRQEELWQIAHFVDLMNLLYDTTRGSSSTPDK